jgi:hypothetical protein
MPKLKIDLNTRDMMLSAVHGYHDKVRGVLHETVSGDQRGLGDIISVEQYLDRIDYGMHGMTDAEGHIAWALGLGRAVFYHAGGDNTLTIGIEQVSRPKEGQNSWNKNYWKLRDAELRATGKLMACISRAHGIKKFPLVYSPDAKIPGWCSHWDVSRNHPESEGHWDCWPVHRGGYYPILSVINIAKMYYRLGWHF